MSERTVTAAEAVVEVLKAEATDHVFGLIGSAAMELYDALYESQDQIRYIGTRHEAAAVHMADAYARASGKTGVCLAGQNGPGASNLVTGIAQAYLAYSPVVSIAGSPSLSHFDRGSFQEIDQHSIFEAITKKTVTVKLADRIPDLLREAFRISMAGRKGPVHLNIPRDLLPQQIKMTVQQPHQYRPQNRIVADSETIEKAAQMLAEARQPVIVAGAGVKWSRASAAVESLAEHLAAPILTSAGHGDAIRSDHPLYAGTAGPRGNKVATGLLQQADLILALGTRLGFNTTFYSSEYLPESTPIIQVDIEPSAPGRYFPVALPVVADARLFAEAVLAAVKGLRVQSDPAWVSQFEQDKAAMLAGREVARADDRSPIQPQRLFAELRAVLPRETQITLDAGTLCLQATDALNYFETPSLYTPLDFGLIGFTYPAAIGVKAALPDAPVVCLSGDGGFGMTMGEIGTAVKNGINVVAIVMNNHIWGAEKAYQRDFFGERYLGADVLNPRFDQVAELFGAKGYRVERPEEIGPAVEAALAGNKPAVIDVEVDPNAIVSFRRDAFKHRSQSK